MISIKKIAAYLNPDITIRCGMVPGNGGFPFVITAVDRSGAVSVLSYGNDIRKTLHLSVPRIVNTTFTDTKTVYIRCPLGSETPDAWLDRNEDRIIPSGFTPDQIINEWDEAANVLYTATVTKASYHDYCRQLSALAVLVRSISPPLRDLSHLYSKYYTEPFILWKISDKESVLGYVKNGALQRICNLWPCIDDCDQDPESVRAALAACARSLSDGDQVLAIIPVSGRNPDPLPKGFLIPGYELRKPPTIDGLPVWFHEAYACSLHTDTHLDFASFGDTQNAAVLEKKRRRFLRAFRTITGTIAGIAALMLIIAASGWGVQKMITRRIEPLQVYINQIRFHEQRLDSLKNRYTRQTQFFHRKSSVTFLMNELQTVFPDGICAEQIDINENELRQWKMDIIALSYSTSLIPQLLSNIEKIPGISQVRLLYSEQVATENGRRHATKMKIECLWKYIHNGTKKQ